MTPNTPLHPSLLSQLEQAALKQKEDIVLDGLRRFLAAMEVLPMVKLMKMKRNDLRNTGIDRIHAVSKIEIPILQGLRIDELSKTAAEHIPKDSKYATPKLLGGDDGEGRGEGDGYGYGEDGVDDVDEDYEDFRSLFKSGDDASAEAKKLNKVAPTAASMGAPQQAAEQDVLAKAAALLSAETHDAALPPPVSTPPPPNLRRRSWRDLQLER